MSASASASSSAVEFRVDVSVEPVPTPAAAAAAAAVQAPDSDMSATGTGTGTGHNKRPIEQAHQTQDTGNKKQKTDPAVVVLEKGRIHFFYRPKVVCPLFVVHPVDAPSVVHTLADIQKTEIILSPLESKDLEQRKKEDDIGGPGARAHQHQQKQQHGHANGDVKEETGVTATHSVHFPHRMIRIPKKVLPEVVADFARPNFAYVEMVSDSLHDLDVDLSTKTYDTATRGVREQPAARLVASGLYEILRHKTPFDVESPTVLAYVIEFPEELGQAQQLLNIKKKGQLMIQIRNPHIGPTTPGGFTGLPEKPQYSKELMELFAGARVAERRFIPLDPVDFLNHRYCEFLVMPVKNESDIVKEWGTIGEELIQQAEKEKESVPSSSDVVEKVASELELEKNGGKTDIDTVPIVTGKLQ